MGLNATALTDAVLEAAASRGLLRRAQRDLAAGLVQRVATEAGTEVLAVDGETVRLGPGGLAAASCTCPAREMCRHVLAAVLDLRDGAAPAAVPPVDMPPVDVAAEIAALAPAALVQAFGRAALKRAEDILADAAADQAGGVEVGTAGAACVVRIAGQPEVHYLAGQGPGGMVSKAGLAGDAKALHAAALLAVRRLHAGQPAAVPRAEASEVPASRVAKGEAAFLDGVADALRDAARAALASAPAVLEDRLLDLAISLRADALPNLAGALRGVAADMAQRRVRAASFDPADALAAIARAYALTQALRRDGEDPRLRGEVRGTYLPHPPLDLLGCGVSLWRTDGGARGVTAYFVAPDFKRPDVMGPDGEGGPRWLTATLARAAGQDPAFVPGHAAASEFVWGSTLARLGQAAFHLPASQCSAEGRLSPRGEPRAVLAPEPWAAVLARHPGLLVEEWGEVGARLAGAFAPTLRRRSLAVQPLLLRAAALGAPGFDGMAQAVTLPVQDRSGAWLELRIGDGDSADRHLDLLAALPEGGAGAVLAVLARVEGADLTLTPIAVCAGTASVLDHLDLPPPRPRAAPPPEGLLKRLQRGLALIEWPGAGRDAGPRFVRAAPAAGGTLRVLAAAADETLALAELGGRMEDPDRLDRLRGLARGLHAGGMAPLGDALLRLADAPAPDRPHRLLQFTHALACWRRLAPAVPLLTRAA